MKKYLASGVVMDIRRNENGDIHVDVICQVIAPERIIEYFSKYKKALNRKMDEATLFNTGKYVVTRTSRKSKNRISRKRK